MTIEGARARDSKTSPEGDGLVHLAIDVLYKLLNDKAVSVGEKCNEVVLWSSHALLEHDYSRRGV